MFLMVAFAFHGLAQIEVQKGKLNKKDYEMLKNSTLVVGVLMNEGDQIEKITKEFRKSWTFSEVIAVPLEKLQDYKDKENIALLAPMEITFYISSSSGMDGQEYKQNYLGLYIPIQKKNGKTDNIEFCRFELDNMVNKNSNFRASLIGVYLKCANAYLASETGRCRTCDDAKPGIKALKDNILYIPDNFNKTYEESTYTLEQLVKDYKYPYEFVSMQQLDELITKAQNDVYFIQYIQSRFEKFITVFNARTGDILYTYWTNRDFKMRVQPKDFKKLASEIK